MVAAENTNPKNNSNPHIEISKYSIAESGATSADRVPGFNAPPRLKPTKARRSLNDAIISQTSKLDSYKLGKPRGKTHHQALNKKIAPDFGRFRGKTDYNNTHDHS